MTHWRKPLYTVETEFGTLHSVDEDDARALLDYLGGGPHPIKLRLEPRIPGWLYIPLMVLAVSVIIGGLSYLFGG